MHKMLKQRMRALKPKGSADDTKKQERLRGQHKLHSTALPLLLCNCYLLTSCALSHHCTDASFTMYATLDAASSLPLLSFVAPFVVSTHLHDSSDSSNQRFNLMPRLSLSSDGLQTTFYVAPPSCISERDPLIPRAHEKRVSVTFRLLTTAHAILLNTTLSCLFKKSNNSQRSYEWPELKFHWL